MPGGVIGNTPAFGAGFPGSSPGWAAFLINIISDIPDFHYG